MGGCASKPTFEPRDTRVGNPSSGERKSNVNVHRNLSKRRRESVKKMDTSGTAEVDKSECIGA